MKIYGIYGKNGAGIYTNWADVLKSKQYICGFKNKKFDNVNDAVDFVIEGLEQDYGIIGTDEVSLQSFKKYNWFYWLEELRFAEKAI